MVEIEASLRGDCLGMEQLPLIDSQSISFTIIFQRLSSPFWTLVYIDLFLLNLLIISNHIFVLLFLVSLSCGMLMWIFLFLLNNFLFLMFVPFDCF